MHKMNFWFISQIKIPDKNSLRCNLMIHIRPTTTADIEACGQIIFEAFQDFADRYGFPTEFPTLAFSIDVAKFGIQDPQVYSIVAIEGDGSAAGQIVGVNFLDACNPIYSVGPIAVAPDRQKRGIGRLLMEAVLERGKGAIGIRLTQDTVNAATLSLYPAVGFDIQELLVLVTGKPKSSPVAEIEVRDLTLDDLEACGELCQQIYGFDRTVELKRGIALGVFKPIVALRNNRITAYATMFDLWGHGVAQTEIDMQALILAAGDRTVEPLTFILPTTPGSFYRWCLREGFRVVKPVTLMSIGVYHRPRGVYFPSAAY